MKTHINTKVLKFIIDNVAKCFSINIIMIRLKILVLQLNLYEMICCHHSGSLCHLLSYLFFHSHHNSHTYSNFIGWEAL